MNCAYTVVNMNEYYTNFTAQFGFDNDRLGQAVNGLGQVLKAEKHTHEIDLEVFTEYDVEDGCFGAYCISNRPLYDPKGSLYEGFAFEDTYPVRHHGHDRGNEP